MLNKSKTARVIFHVDMNSFYASVEIALDPSLKGKPVAIAGNVEDRKGIIVTSSYEARAKGVRTTMPLWEAKRKCPDLIVLPPSFERYRNASKKIFDMLCEYSDLVEPVSIDEGYIDLTDASLRGFPLDIAHEIQTRLLNELRLPCSIGIAPNKFLSKMASDMKKPLGITVLRKREIPQILWPMKIEEMHGVGKKTMEKFHEINIFTIGDLANKGEWDVKLALGKNGEKLWQRARGMDNREVDPEASNSFKTVGVSTTLPEDLVQFAEMDKVLHELADSLELRLKRKKVVATTLQLTIRYAGRKTVTRSETLSNPIQEKTDLALAAKKIFKEHWNGEPVRLLGVSAIQVIEKNRAYRQLDLFSYHHFTKDEQLFETLDKIQRKYGEHSVQKGIEKKGENRNGKKNET
ncbi:DNA polymerase IV [Alkalihalobacillus sp. AL-G]|uniref:DNA polymerase IV n=1 Tax=Alkalihalobacillus sp. AL-G TaxID=2926399 RepID=UPI00272D5581|nr:DNA polymerase IV [Alkalihalobacillus sp. AL-G]WLD91952.1 DNA polymerase IV [Alkalihalobacillus sp. AL-G]